MNRSVLQIESGLHMGSWTVGNLTTIASENRMPELIKTGEHTPTNSAELYRVAKVFLQSVVQQGETI